MRQRTTPPVISEQCRSSLDTPSRRRLRVTPGRRTGGCTQWWRPSTTDRKGGKLDHMSDKDRSREDRPDDNRGAVPGTGRPWTVFRSFPYGAQAAIWVFVGLLLGSWVDGDGSSSSIPTSSPSPDRRVATTVTVPTDIYVELARSKCIEAYDDASVRNVIRDTGEVGIDFAGDNYIKGFTQSADSPRDPALLRRMEAACETALSEAAGL